jgi:hypothetical protein
MKPLLIVSEQSRDLYRLIQLYTRKGRWLHPNPASVRDLDPEGSLYPFSSAGGWARSNGGER